MLTYGDGMSDIDLTVLLTQHEASGKAAPVFSREAASAYWTWTNQTGL